MSVFDGGIKTSLRTSDPLTDYLLPEPGALVYKSITQTAALTSTDGHDALLIKGNRDRQMNGSESTRITQDRSHDVGGNQKKQITGNKDEGIIGNFIHQTTGNLHRTVVGATNDLYTLARTVAHKADQLLQEPVNFMHYIEHLQNSGLHYEQAYGFYNSLIGNYFNIVASNVDIKGLQLGLTGAEANFTGPSVAKHDAKIAAGELNARFDAVYSRIGAIKPVVHITNIKLTAITLIGGIALGDNQMV